MWTNNAIDVLNNPNKIVQIIQITQKNLSIRSNHQRCSVRKGVRKNFT